MAGKGWIKLHRKIRDSSIFNDHQLFRLWMICLTEATHKERDQIIGKQTVHLMPGQFVTGRFQIHELYNYGLKKDDQQKGDKTVYRWLEFLESSGFLTINKTNKFSVVTIDNWAFYQSEEDESDHQNGQQMTSKRPTNDQQMTTNKNVKNVKNDENVKEDIKTIYDFWNSLEIIKHRELTQKMKSGINARLEGRTAEEIIQAMQNYKTIITSDLYWYTYKFSLDKFMNPKNLDGFMTDNNPFETYRKQGGGGNGKYQRKSNGPTQESRSNASRNEDLYIGTTIGEDEPISEELLQRIRG
ncbi:hypothetical protein P4H27_26125 [Paenibacillus taichungensis]|uniref:hypothetical protein n=1 Tax=Paenibacillus taichungensis TaxID=484184 RepID=UPI002DB86FC8|nr:hypothetical protein [Paenibacillus taichungensis]MEC0110452.1 hypothetical protein [Paenibacillus taichungensis]MEC0200129.1 hypothetical protein [Paenibacillus taichungensis]